MRRKISLKHKEAKQGARSVVHRFRRSTIFRKFLIAYVLFAVFGFIATGTLVESMTGNYVKRNQAARLYAAAMQIAGTYASNLYQTKTSVESVRGELLVFSKYFGAQIWIINPSGRMVIDTARTIDNEEEIVVKGFDANVTKGSYYTEGDFFHSFTNPVLSVIAPITGDYRVRAYVVIHYPLSQLNAQVAGYMNIAYILLVLVLLLSCIILIFYAELVYVPIRKITGALEQYAAGNMDYDLSVDSDDEIGYLAATVSYMAGEIARNEEDQKKFIANVSHDFRSPLTSIRGYVEAMRDGTIPAEKYPHYLEVVLNETDRLTKLTNGLLSLNNLSDHGMRLVKTDCDINEMIRQTANSFEGTCRSREISLELVMTDQVMLVEVDQEKILQVLYNLLDNAIKFSPENGKIRIETTEKRSKIFVSVKDSGIGIPKEDQKLIFERFYKSDHSRGKDKKGTGLGLAIVKEIIKAHGENINVISTVGVGTEFILSLPKARIMDEV